MKNWTIAVALGTTVIATTYLSKPAIASKAKAQASHLTRGTSAFGTGIGTYDLCAFSSVPGTTNQTRADSTFAPVAVCSPSEIRIGGFLFFGGETYNPAVGVRSVPKPPAPPRPGNFRRKITSDSTDSFGNVGHGEAIIDINVGGVLLRALGTKAGLGEGAGEAIDPIYFAQATVIDNYNPIINDTQITVDELGNIAGIEAFAAGSVGQTIDENATINIWDLGIVIDWSQASPVCSANLDINSQFFNFDTVAYESQIESTLNGICSSNPAQFSLSSLTLFEPGTQLILPGNFSYEDGVKAFAQGTTVPEPSSTLSLLALGTLGAASTLKRKLKPSKSSKKETTKVS
jgi:uncharacterized protein YuzE